MTLLSINQSSDDLPIIKRHKKSLVKGIKLTSAKDIDKAVILANYLCALEKYQEAIDLLESFILNVKSVSDRRDVWGSNGQGIILRAYLSDLIGDSEYKNKLINIIYADDIMTDRCGRYELYLESLEDHEENMEYALSETQKFKCEVICQEILTFLYFYEMLPFYKSEAPANMEKDLINTINKCYAELKAALSA